MKRSLFIVFGGVILLCSYFVVSNSWTQKQRGQNLNRLAWEATYIERKNSVPREGPREGYWGSRLGSKRPHERLGWTEPPTHLDGLIDIDEQGLQIVRSEESVSQRIFVSGGSVAFGAYSSSLLNTYFYKVSDILKNRGISNHIYVSAAGAWKSVQDVNAVELFSPRFHPTIVVLINGLNDLTSGATAMNLFGEQVATLDGSPWWVGYHTHDYSLRVKLYLNQIERALEMLHGRGVPLLVVLQPALFEKKFLSPIEEKLLRNTLASLGNKEDLTRSYMEIRAGLNSLKASRGLHWLDCSNFFGEEAETSFTDIWHFSDFGHQKLASAISDKVYRILKL